MVESTKNKRLPNKPTQERSKIRYEKIIDAANAFLETREPADITVEKIAQNAGLQPQSVYRLFPSAAAINFGLAQRHLTQMAEFIVTTANGEGSSWQLRMRKGMERGKAYYEQHPPAAKLILSSGVAYDIRVADRENVTRIAKSTLATFLLLAKKEGAVVSHLSRETTLMRIEIAIDIIDAVWGQSFHRHGEIIPLYFEESVRAAVSYLENYIPRSW